MKKKTVKNSIKKSTPKSITCAAKVTPIKATLESEITPEIEVRKTPRHYIY